MFRRLTPEPLRSNNSKRNASAVSALARPDSLTFSQAMGATVLVLLGILLGMLLGCLATVYFYGASFEYDRACLTRKLEEAVRLEGEARRAKESAVGLEKRLRKQLTPPPETPPSKIQ